jgi:predicted kinase
VRLPPVPEPPLYRVDWQALDEDYAWIRALKGVEQDPIHHAEGDVWIHTRMVCEALTELAAWRALAESERRIVFWAALLHDVSKPACTREEGGRVTARGHSGRGEVEARSILWRLGAPFDEREHVARLILAHQLPFFAIEKESAERLAISVSQVARCDLLALVAEADMRGRRCEDQRRLLDNIELFRELCRDTGCFSEPFRFATEHSRVEYFRNESRDPRYRAHDDTEFEVVLMSGLPGSGKDQWLKHQAPGLPVVSLDTIRDELDVPAGETPGEVIDRAKQRAREHLRAKRPFAWNATNLSRKLRRPLLDFFADYAARVRIVYCETSWHELLERNHDRDRSVPEAAIRRMLERWQVPDITEARGVEWVL